jgi:hypothetical protein
MRKRTAPTPWWAWFAGALALAGAVAIGLYLARTGKQAVSELPGQSAARLPESSAPAATPIQHPIEQAAVDQTDTTPLPALDASDAAVIAALGAIAGDGLGAILNPEHVIQRIVATVDALPRPKLASDAFPVRAPPGTFVAHRNGDRAEIDARNAARYAAYARAAEAVDAKKLVAWYAHAYPLFQQAYRELGYRDGYFNDRLVFVIDHLLATPDITEPIALSQPNVLYEYADPTLESRSAGQKLLLRSGPENEAVIKAKLREIRAALAGQPPPA